MNGCGHRLVILHQHGSVSLILIMVNPVFILGFLDAHLPIPIGKMVDLISEEFKNMRTSGRNMEANGIILNHLKKSFVLVKVVFLCNRIHPPCHL
jgi:hypothetical protein